MEELKESQLKCEHFRTLLKIHKIDKKLDTINRATKDHIESGCDAETKTSCDMLSLLEELEKFVVITEEFGLLLDHVANEFEPSAITGKAAQVAFVHKSRSDEAVSLLTELIQDYKI